MPRISNLVVDGNVSLNRVGQLVSGRIQNVTTAGRAVLQEQLRQLEDSTGISRAGNIIFDIETGGGTLFVYSSISRQYEPVSFDLEGDVSYQGEINPTNADTADVVASKGYQYVVTSSGVLSKTGVTFQPNATVEIGDIVLFWDETLAYVLQTNFGPATTEKKGHVEYASQTDFDNGNGDGVVSPEVFASSQYASDIQANTTDHASNKDELTSLKSFAGSATPLQTESLNLADAVNELKGRADSASGEISDLRSFLDEGVSLSTIAQVLADAVNELVLADSAAGARSTAIEGNVSTLQTDAGDVSTLETEDISSLVAAINELHSQINTLDSSSTQGTTDLNNYDTENVAADNSISRNSLDILGLKFRQDDIESDLSVFNATLDDLQAQVTGNDNDIINLQPQITSNDGDISLLQTEMGIVEGRMQSLEDRSTVLETEMDSAEARLTAVEGRLTVNENDIDALELAVGSIASLNTVDSDLVGAINEVHTELDLIAGRMTQGETDISNLQTAAGTDTLTTSSQTLSGALNELKTAFDNNDSDFGAVDTRIAFREQTPEIKAYNQENITLPKDTAVRITHNLNLPNPAGFTIGIMEQSGDLLEVDVDVVDANNVDLTAYEDVSGASIFILGLATELDISGNHPAGVDRVVNGVIVPANALYMQGSLEEYVITQSGVVIVTNP